MRIAIQATPASPSCKRRQIQYSRIRGIRWIGRRKTDQIPNRTVRQELIVRTQTGVGDCPLPKRVVHGFVILPLERIGRIVHPDLEVLSAAEEEIPIVRELSRVAPRVEMNDLIRHRARNKSLQQSARAIRIPPLK